MILYSWSHPAVFAVRWDILVLACFFTLSASETGVQHRDGITTTPAPIEIAELTTPSSSTLTADLAVSMLSSTPALNASDIVNITSSKADAFRRRDGILAAFQGHQNRGDTVSSTVVPIAGSTTERSSTTPSDVKQNRGPLSNARPMELNSVDDVFRHYNVPTLQPPERLPSPFQGGFFEKSQQPSGQHGSNSNAAGGALEQLSEGMVLGQQPLNAESYSLRGTADGMPRYAIVSNDDGKGSPDDTAEDPHASHVVVIAACMGGFGALGFIAYKLWKSYMAGPTDYRAAWRDAFSKGPQRQRIQTDVPKSGILPTVLGRQTREPEYRPL